jgi:uncharacterized protein YdhG (YjbR/CyaY superfamily)
MAGMAVATVDEYLASLDPEVRGIVASVREVLLRAVPGAEEKIRYGMPAVMLGGRYAIHYAAWKRHLGLYPVPALPTQLEAEVAPLRSGADTVNFLYSKPIPLDLIERIAAAIVDLRRG